MRKNSGWVLPLPPGHTPYILPKRPWLTNRVNISVLVACIPTTAQEHSRAEALLRILFTKEHIPTTSAEKERVVVAAPEEMASECRPSKRTMLPDLTTDNCDRGDTYTRTHQVGHPTRPDIIPTRRNWEEDVSSARPKRDAESVRNNTVITGGQTDTAFERQEISTSK